MMGKTTELLRSSLETLWRVPTRVFGSRNERLLKTYAGAVAKINALEPEIAALSDSALAGKTNELKKRYAEGATLEELLPEAFAVVREAAKRTLRMRHFDVQLVGGMVLNDGKIAEMKTGEGKTLVATLPAYLNALTGAGVHIVTVNDYLASRDADWMGKIYRFLGLSVGVNLPHMEPADKRNAYAADITYGTNNEFGFDYLRDNMAMHVDERFQRGLHYAIVDEVDSILIDEARTPLIISGQAEDRTEIYYRMNEVAPLLTRQKEENAPGDFWVDEKNHQILLSESGHQKAEEILARIGMLPQGASLYEPAYINLVHQLYAALRAHHLFHRGQPVLVGTTSIENSELLSGLLGKDKLAHQVLNAKQHAREAEIVAQAGRPKMITIATNMAGRGTDIVLGGNVEKQCELLEAIENLAPEEKKLRTDKLRSEWQALHNQVVKAGGLHIIGTERHESRRIDNQLRGRSGRQGDPGSSRFYMSLEDPLLRIFAGDRINRIMVMLKMPEGEAIEHAMVTRSIESAQRKVEARNFDIRKQLLEYDDVANDQRKEIYAQRNEILDAKDVSALVTRLRAGVIVDMFRMYVPEESVEEQWDIAGLESALKSEFNLSLPIRAWLDKEAELGEEEILQRIVAAAEEAYRTKIPDPAREQWKQFERYQMLQILDAHWREHLAALDHLRQGIHLRGYAQKNPKQEYKREAFELFGAMVEAVKLEVTKTLTAVEIRTREEVPQADDSQHVENVRLQHADYEDAVVGDGNGDTAIAEAATKKKAQPIVRHTQKVGRNDPCPCGSGKKYKHCHGKLT